MKNVASDPTFDFVGAIIFLSMCQTKICKACRIEKNLSNFRKCTNTKDILTSRCSLCIKHNVYEELDENLKRCTKCDTIKDKALFSKSNRTKDSKQPQCKNCLYKQDKINKEKRLPNIKPDDGYKVCSKCSVEKHVDEFYLNSNLFMGVHSECILCTKDKVSKWAKDNPDKMSVNGKKYRESHKTEEQLRSRKYRENNKEERRLYKLTWRQYNKERINEKDRNRRKTDPLFRIKGITRCLFKDAFLRACEGNFPKKSKRSEEVLCCSFSDFMGKLESQFLDWMSWENQGVCLNDSYKCSWHIDHIIPVSYAKTEEDIYLLNHWSNLQPLCGKENMEKNSKIYPCTNLELMITFWEDRYEYINLEQL